MIQSSFGVLKHAQAHPIPTRTRCSRERAACPSARLRNWKPHCGPPLNIDSSDSGGERADFPVCDLFTVEWSIGDRVPERRGTEQRNALAVEHLAIQQQVPRVPRSFGEGDSACRG